MPDEIIIIKYKVATADAFLVLFVLKIKIPPCQRKPIIGKIFITVAQINLAYLINNL